MPLLTAWGCQGATSLHSDSLGWQGGDFAFSASFLILNEIMRPGASFQAIVPPQVMSQVCFDQRHQPPSSSAAQRESIEITSLIE